MRVEVDRIGVHRDERRPRVVRRADGSAEWMLDEYPDVEVFVTASAVRRSIRHVRRSSVSTSVVCSPSDGTRPTRGATLLRLCGGTSAGISPPGEPACVHRPRAGSPGGEIPALVP